MKTCAECGRPALKRGFCNTHYEAKRRAGELSRQRPVDRVDRFWSYVDKSGTCWTWTGAMSTGGYGRIHWEGVDGQRLLQQAHRVSYELLVGPIPDGLQLDHLCRNRACVNPSHLEPVTVRENLLRGDGVGAQNAAKTHCPNGHAYEGENLYLAATGRQCQTCRSAEGVKAGAKALARRRARVVEVACVECGRAFVRVGDQRARLCSDECRKTRNNRCAKDSAQRARDAAKARQWDVGRA